MVGPPIELADSVVVCCKGEIGEVAGHDVEENMICHTCSWFHQAGKNPKTLLRLKYWRVGDLNWIRQQLFFVKLTPLFLYMNHRSHIRQMTSGLFPSITRLVPIVNNTAINLSTLASVSPSLKFTSQPISPVDSWGHSYRPCPVHIHMSGYWSHLDSACHPTSIAPSSNLVLFWVFNDSISPFTCISSNRHHMMIM